MSKASKSLVIVGSAVLAMTTLAATAEAGKHHGGGFRFHHHRHVYIAPVYTETYRVVRKPAVQAEGRRDQVCRRLGPGLRRGEQGLARRPEPLLDRQAGVDLQERLLVLRQLQLVRDGRHLAHQRAGGAEVRRLRDRPGLRREDRAHGRPGQRAEGARRGAESCAQDARPAGQDREKAPAEESAQLAPPADGNAVRASECKKYFPSVGEMLPVPCTSDRSSL